MSFVVYVDCSSGSCFAVAARNHGYHAEQWGLDYVDPQPILEGDEWYEGFDYKLRWARDWMPRIEHADDRDLPYVMAAEVDDTGIAAPGCLYWVKIMRSPTSQAGPVVSWPVLPVRAVRDIEGAIASLGNVRYLPGMVEGTPTTMRLYEQSVTTFHQDGPVPGFGFGHIDCN